MYTHVAMCVVVLGIDLCMYAVDAIFAPKLRLRLGPIYILHLYIGLCRRRRRRRLLCIEPQWYMEDRAYWRHTVTHTRATDITHIREHKYIQPTFFRYIEEPFSARVNEREENSYIATIRNSHNDD